MYALNLDKETKRVLSATYLEYAAPDAVFTDHLPPKVANPEFDAEGNIKPESDITNYLFINRNYVYDPLPKPEPVDPGPSDHELLMALLGVSE